MTRIVASKDRAGRMSRRVVVMAGVGLTVLAALPVAEAAAASSAKESFEAGLTAEKGGDWAKALDAFQAAVRADRAFSPAAVNCHVGICQAKLGRPGPAIAALEASLRADPSAGSPEPYRLLGSIYLKQGRPGDARTTVERGLKLHAADPWLHEFMRDALARLRKPAEARVEGLKAEELQWKQPPAAGKTPLGFPFAGTWKVKAGNGDGDHAGLAAKYAWDFVKVDESGAEQDAKARDKRLGPSWLCWDAQVLSPADGEVAAMEGAVADNVIAGSANPLAPFGNYVIVRHAEGEFSLLGFLKKGSPAVKAGEMVKRGQVLARCGNSGASLQPQLRFVLLAQADPLMCRPAAFDGWTGTVAGGPLAGETVKSTSVALAAPAVPSATLAAPAPISATTAVSATVSVSAGAAVSATKAEPSIPEAGTVPGNPPAADSGAAPTP